MKIYTKKEAEKNNNEKQIKGVFTMSNNELGRPIPPHERKSIMQIEFDENDWKLMKKIFEDEDTAIAAAEIIRDAPPEIQILAIQLMNIIMEEN